MELSVLVQPRTVTRSLSSMVAPRLSTLGQYLRTEAGGAVVMLAAAVAALVWANSPWRDAYFGLWASEVAIEIGPLRQTHDLGHWVSDGLMTGFFLLIGLEIRRELDLGDLRDRRRIAVPVVAAVGGMVVPALAFLALNPDPAAARGWAMVMATDTAFGLGILALVGRRAPIRLRVFLLTVMIVDDIGAVAVIAVAYSDVAVGPLLVAAALLGAMGVARHAGVQRSAIYWLLGLASWLATLEAGVHPTVAGVAIGFMTSAYAPRREALQAATGVARAFREQPSPELASAAAQRIRLALSPNDRLQHALQPWTSFLIVPLFALANAGVELTPESIDRALASSITWGVIVGLVGGKAIGIMLGAWLASRPWTADLPLPIPWLGVVKLAPVGGVGFTVSLLVAQLSYSGPLLQEAKLGILAASVVAAILSIGVFRLVRALPADWLRRAEASGARGPIDLLEPVDPERDHIRGPIDAPVTLLQYGDYECPHCREVAPVVKDLLTRFDGELRFVARHLPLPDVHPNAALAAEAAEAAAAQDRFWEMHDALYESGEGLHLPDLIRRAREIDLDTATFERELRAGRHARRVARDLASAEASGVAGTPTFFINDVRYTEALNSDGMARAVSAALRIAPRPQEAPTPLSVPGSTRTGLPPALLVPPWHAPTQQEAAAHRPHGREHPDAHRREDDAKRYRRDAGVELGLPSNSP